MSEKREKRSRKGARPRRLRLALLAATTLGLVALWSPGHTPSAQTAGCGTPHANPIVWENQCTGNPETEWDITGAGDPNIQGFTTDISVNKGESVSFKIDTGGTPSVRLEIYRMGYYGGMGARRVTTINTTGQNQPDCLNDAATGLIDCGNWTVTTSWSVPATATSGIYFAKATRLDTGGASHIVFVVRDDTGNSDLLFQTSDTTWQAYNQYGGNSLYVGSPDGRAYKVSYNRPFTTRGTTPEDWVFNAEYPMVRWLEANGFNVSYSTGVDTDRRGGELLDHNAFLSVGHDEYWSGTQRANVEAARAAGVHLAFFSGNEVFWKTRWENSHRTLVTYKETHANAKIDPLPNVWTGTWRDPRFSPPADGGRPENALTGTIFVVNSGTVGIRVPAAEGKLRFWRNTPISLLATGTFADLPDGTLGYEWDEDQENGFRPPGLIRMSDTTVSDIERLQDYGSTYATGTANHALTLYKHSSGALVFGAGTVQWAWGLDSNHDRGSAAPSPGMQQATVNLFADMGAQPSTLQPGLLTAAASTDTIAPTSAIVSPTNGAGVPANSTITVSGTAVDAGGGVVGGVEISVDGGANWRRAIGRESWTFSWQTGGPKSVTLFSRAVDDSGNLGPASSGVAVTVGTGTPTCPCSIWSPAQTPTNAAENDANAVEVGTRFRSDISGYISGIRFYKSAQNTGVHIGNLWSNTGTLLSSVTFTGETASGWQQAMLPTPVQITANTTYVVSYHTDTGFYSADVNYFASAGVQNAPLYAPRDGEFGANGVYTYGASAFPNESAASQNYWVDVVFVTSVPPDTTPPTVTTVNPTSGASGVPTSVVVSATFNEALNPSTVTTTNFELRNSSNVLVPASVAYTPATRTATLTPTSPLASSTGYTARLRGGATGIRDVAGNSLAEFTWPFSTAAPPPPPPTQGPGGPILVVSPVGNSFARYYAEILRAEGLNSFAVMDITAVSAATLTSYDVVILGETALTSAQVTMLTNWVTGGGNLIAMRPDKQLASLLGLTDAAATLAEGYLLVNTTAAPGAGIVGETMQYHGTADRYTPSGATVVATLYSNATTTTANPAVTLRSVGGNGGQAAAFTYDLARSIVYTRQGNPAWSGQDRDGVPPIRSDDLFFGGAQPDWVNLDKVAIPQADEQQRLLVNLIGHMNSDRKPLPRFWYFPRGHKAVVVMTGDDHANNGTTQRFNAYTANSAPGCSVQDWECIRATSYIYSHTQISNAQVAAFVAQGYEIALHIKASGPSPDCNNYTAASLGADYASQLSTFTSTFPGATAPTTNRTHCIVWSDYTTQADVSFANGIRLDTNYYYFPAPWVQDRPGLMNGSGLAMRFARTDGTMIDVYQASTPMTDESAQTYPFTVDALLDRALGEEGYYGAFVTNMHTDFGTHAGSDAIVASAQARSVPVITARQLLNWLDGKNGSSFSNISWNTNTLSFSIEVGAGARGLRAMLPINAPSGVLASITRNGTPVSYTVEVIKGVAYAFFPGDFGNYSALYQVDTTPPVISGVAASTTHQTASVTWSTNEIANSRVDFGTAPTVLASNVTVATYSTSHVVPITGLTPSTTYYYRVRSEDGSGNATTHPPAASQPLSFVTAAPPPPPPCPCSIWPPSQVPGTIDEPDNSAVELGLKFRSTFDGFITGIRFYKGPQNTGTHVGKLWTANGTLLGSVTFANETASGWQQANLQSPVAITANTTYVVSYFAPNGHYSEDEGYFGSSGVTNGPLQAPSTGSIGGNGVYTYGGGFPSSTFNGANYWVDVVFTAVLGPDTTPPTVISVTPAAGATSVATATTVTGTFDESMASSTINTSTFQLRDGSGALVTSAVTYHGPSRTATLTPGSPLAYSTTYTATILGGSSGVKDTAGNALAANRVWSFTTTAPPPDEGPGGPILVIASSGNHFGRYYAEILRAEGLNAFTVTDLSLVTPATLSTYDVVLLGESALTAQQVTMFSDWVAAGGNLIAMRPDKQLASLLGLVDAGATLGDAYLGINTTAAPGAGIVSDTLQFHGIADRYTVSGATVVATLFSTAATATSNPAITIRNVGTAGGTAAAFTYDLARSVVYTRQGNPAWAGQERDGLTPIRSDDLFFGGTSPNWVDLSKVAIPQADEQQRLLANLIGLINRDRKPLPKFWYLPNGYKAAVVMTGDDHGANGTTGRFDIYTGNSTPGCSVDDWQCIRATSYIYPGTPITPAQASSYTTAGFEIAAHMSTSCSDYTPTSLAANFASDLGQFAAQFPALPAPRTNRTHCVVWSDYSSQPEVALANGIRLDTTYYYWPSTWVNNVPGMFTGSGMPMRFARADGSMIDVYQATTQMTDESEQGYPFTIDALLNRALGPEGYYGTFVANMHTDNAVHSGSVAIVASAQARGVPVISARQLLTWLDGRNGSSFDDLSWTVDTLTFTISPGAGARGLRAMVPVTSKVGQLLGITRNGTAVPHTIETIKGGTYAFFAADAGNYAVQYDVDSTPPVISALAATSGETTATITWETNELATTRVNYGTSPGSLTSSVEIPGERTSHSIPLTGLASGASYYYRATSADTYGNSASAPTSPAAFTTTVPPPFALTDTTATEFGAGALGPGIYLSQTDDGEISLQPAVGGDFFGTALPAGWSSAEWNAGGASTVSGGMLLVDGARANTDALFGPGQSLEFVATFGSNPFRHVGFGVTLNDAPWAIFSTFSGDGSLYARTNNGTSSSETLIPGNWLNAPHRYRVDWTPTAVVYFIDGVVVATHNAVITTNMRPLASDLHADANPLRVDWLRMGPYATAGTFVSRVLDAGAVTTWGSMSWTASGGSGVAMSIRIGNSPTPDGSWTAFTPVGSSGSPISGASRYVQYQATLSGDGTSTPIISDVTISALGAGTLISVGDVTVTEGSSGNATATFTVRLSRSSTNPVTVSYATADGTARAPSDYAGATGSVTFVPGSMAETVPITIIGDSVEEPDEALALNLMLPGNAALLDSHGIATIIDDDTLPGVSIADRTVVEGNTGVVNAVFTVTLTESAGHNVVMNYATSNGTAAAGADYTTTSGQLTIPAGATSGTITVPVVGEAVTELDETFLVTLSGLTGGVLTRGQATGTITNDDATTINVSDVTVTEGNSGSLSAVLTVSLSAPSSQTVTVNYATADGTAVAPSDYSPVSLPLSFAPGVTSLDLAVAIFGDTRDEINETLTVVLSAPVNVVIGDGSGLITILDNDGTPSLSIADITRAEGNTGTVNAVFTVTLTAISGQTVTVAYATADGTATAPADYTTTTGTLTIAAGTASGQILVPVVGDLRDEPNETFVLNLSGPTNATLADTQSVATITDNDAGPSISINNVTVTEGNAGTVNAVFTVTLNRASSFPITVNYATSNNTAVAPNDYTAVSGTLSFPPDTTTTQITVPVAGDVLDEANETYNVNLSGATNATIGDALGVGTITDNDATPSVVITNVTIAEPVAGPANAVFTVTMSAVSGRQASVNYATGGGSAAAGTDYTTTTGTLTFAPGVTSLQINVPVLVDTLDEANETFNVNLSGASALTIADSQGVGTINDDDPLPSVSINNVTLTEGPTGTTLATFTLTLSTASGRSLSVGWITANGTATSPSDYTAASGTVTFAAGVTSQTISITIVGNAVAEPNETFVVNLRTPNNVTIGDGQGVCTILNDD
jgi:hypothetical protein